MLRTQLIDQPGAWDDALLKLGAPHVLQSWSWGELKLQTGWRAQRWLWTDDDQPVAAAAVLTRRVAGRIPLSVSYIPRGPMLDWTDGGLARTVLAHLARESRRSGAIFLKIDPEVRTDQEEGMTARGLLTSLGWHPSGEQIQFRNTVMTDLTLDEESLLAAMKPKCRYNIRLAERKGVEVRAGTAADLPSFYSLYAETGARDGFLVRPYSYYRNIWERFMMEAKAHLLLAEVDGQCVAGIMLFRFGATAWYFYGASSGVARALMPNHALQWAALRWAKAAGCTRYDWWGAPDVLDESDPMWGVYRFKEGFGGEFTPGLGAWDLPLQPALYQIYSEVMPKLLAWARRRHGGKAQAQRVSPAPLS